MKKLIEKLKHPSEKTKHRLQGVAIGSLLGSILTLTCVGVVGCSMTQGEKQQPQAKRLVADRAFDTWTIDGLYDASHIEVSDVDFVCAGVTYHYFYFSGEVVYYGSNRVWEDAEGGWLDYSYDTIDVYSYGNSGFGSWLNDYATRDGAPVTTSSATSEATISSASTTSEATTSSATSQATSSEPETTSLDKSLGFVFGDQNPFSAWAVNPLSGDPAVNYDGGAPWLLYTGKPSGSGATTAQTALSTDHAVGSFYVAGNPSQTFDTIRVVTLNLTTDNAFILNGSTDAVQISADQYARGAFMVSEVQYRNSRTSASIKVYNFGLTSAKLNGQDINALTSGSWLNVGYRSILWTGGGDLTINGYTAPASWWLENNALSSASAVSTMILGNSSTGVFGLLASAFTCWGSIFGLALVPGLTIGTLLFVPLVVLVIFSIIKLLQK